MLPTDSILPDDDARLSFRCPQCLKPLQAPAKLAGTQSRCPHCQKPLRVPYRSSSDAKGEDYPLQKEGSPSPAQQEASVLVVCSVCHGRMLAAENQIGKQVICPDCGTAAVVVRPAEKPAKKPFRTASEIGEYELASEARQRPGAVPAAQQEFIPVICELCHTRMLASPDQVGSRMKCPDCGTATVVPPMPAKRKKIDVMEGAGEGYALANYDAIKQRAAASAPVEPEEPEEEEPEPRLVPRRKRLVLPEHPFLDGTFTFPFSRSVYVRTIMLTAWMIFFATVFLLAKYLLTREDPSAWLLGAMLGGVSAILVLVWFLIAASTVFTVLRETSEGINEIEEWPSGVFLDWMGDAGWFFCALCMSVTPGAAIVWLLANLEISGKMASMMMPLSIFFVFPFILMSMIETNAIFGMVSWPVLRTLFTATSGWVRFYLTSAVLFAAIACIDWLAFALDIYLGDIVMAMTQAIAWIVYFRLMGRLAWYCTCRSGRADLEAGLDEVLADDDSDEDLVNGNDLL
jgi:DNA-directed RNA polymerase subunit RPC12/RpoP